MKGLYRRGDRIEIQFTDHTGARRTVRLGVVGSDFAEDFAHNVRRLVGEKKLGHRPSKRVGAWLDEIGSHHRKQLAKWGLAEEHFGEVTLAELVKSYTASLDVLPSTLRNIRQATDNLVSHFGESFLLSRIRDKEVIAFRTWLGKHGSTVGDSLARATVSRRIRRAREVFEHAVREGWIAANPFRVLDRGSEVNRENDFFVGAELFKRVLAAAGCQEFKTLLSLTRWAALRCPSELLGLTWQDVSWEHSTLCVASPKTKRHAGGEMRVVPIFAECREELERLWEQSPEGGSLLFPNLQHHGSALYSRLKVVCKRAGVAIWPRPFDNMRATRESELLETYPIQTVAGWLGHSPQIALKHYAQIAKEHHTRAVGAESAAKSAALMVYQRETM